MLHPVALQGPQVVRISKLFAKLLEDGPVSFVTATAYLLVQMVHQIRDDAVIVEKRVIYVDEDYDLFWIHDEPPP